MSFTGLLVDGDDGETHHTRQYTSTYLSGYVSAYVSKSCSGLRVEGDDVRVQTGVCFFEILCSRLRLDVVTTRAIV
jgi:hypothetical protein